MEPLRVVVTGSESTGKTTLARALATHYGTVWVPEYARRWVEATGAAPTASDVDPIARGQMAEEARLAAKADRLLILDTDLLSTVVYSRHYFGSAPTWIEREAARRAGDLYLLAGTDVPWAPDGLHRDRPADREHIQSAFRAAVDATGRPVVPVAGDRDERVRRAVKAVDALLADRDAAA